LDARGVRVRQELDDAQKLRNDAQGLLDDYRSKRAQAESDALATRLREALGTKVALRRGRKGGTIIIHFYSDEELNAIAEAILGE